ncbi:MAG: hypothetical protein ABIR63_06525 [Sphingomicrobium sp.]
MRPLILAAATLIALTGCARSDDASVPVNRSDADVAPADMPIPVPSFEELNIADAPIAAAIRQSLASTGGISADARWLMNRIDLNGDGTDEAVAYLLDPKLCGTGGCSLFVLTDRGSNAWEVTDVIGPAQLPVYQLPKGADGWTMLGVSVGGSAAVRQVMGVAHEAEGYADNPTTEPTIPARTEGAPVLIEDDRNHAAAVPRA